MSETKTFNVADPAQLREVLHILVTQQRATYEQLDAVRRDIGTLAASIAMLPDHEPIVKADLAERFRAAANARPDASWLRFLADVMSGALPAGSSPPSPSPPERGLTLVWSREP